MGTAFFILLLLTLAGVIAYTADLLGRRLGKKRLTLFGLRPKHTAILLTVVTGVAIAGLTFGAALASIPWFRRVVTQGERLAVQNIRLQEQNRALDQRIQERVRENEELAARNAALERRNEELRRASAALEAESRRLSAANRTLADQNRSLRRRNAELGARNVRLADRNSRLMADNRALQARQSSLQEEVTRLMRQARALERQVSALHEEVASYRERGSVFRRGQILSERRVLPNPPPDLLRSIIANTLFEAERRARDTRLAAGDRSGSPVQWVPPPALEGGAADGNRIARWLAQQATRFQNRPLVVRAVVDRNCAVGRPVPVRLECFPNDRVFVQGQLVAEDVIDGRQSDGQILREVIAFLTQQVRRRAIARSMEPGDDGLGSLDPDDVLDACRRIRQLGQPAVIRARARTDIHRAGPLQLDLEVAPAPVPALGR